MNANLTLLLLSFLFLTPLSLNAQFTKNTSPKKKFVKKYKQLLDKDAEIVSFSYYQVFEKKEDEFILKTFNPDKKVVTHYQTYQDEKMNALNGPYKEWYDNGNLWKEGHYENDEKTGRWNFYHQPDGDLYSYGTYEKGVEHGDWYSVDSIGRITEKYHYLNGQLDGEYLRYDISGNVFQKSSYKLGEEIENEILDSVYYQKQIGNVEVFPVLKECSELEGEEREKCGNTKYLQYVYGNIRYPEIARVNDVQGKALIRFLITKEGKITEIEALRGVCKEIEEECIRIIEKSPEWSPGLKDGKQVNVYFNLPVNFRLE